MSYSQTNATGLSKMSIFVFNASDDAIARMVKNTNQMLYIMGYKNARCRVNEGTNSGIPAVDIVENGDGLAARDHAKIIGYLQGFVDCLKGGDKWNAR